MKPQLKTFVVANKRLFQFLLIFFASIFLMKGMITPSVAQSPEERELEDRIPKHLPIKVKIKKEKEKAFRDLKNDKWMRDFQLEVTNTGSKPIYYLSLLIVLPEITIPNGTDTMGFGFHFGRRERYNIETKAEPDDVSIKPGETYVFSLSELRVQNWERFRKRENKPDPKKLILKFQLLSFGDGTGFWGNEGMAAPHPPDTKSSLDRCNPPPSLNNLDAMRFQQASWRSQPAIFSTDDLPAERLLANFLSLDSSMSIPLKPKPQSQLCCSGNGCFRSKPYLRDCACDSARKNALQGTTCSDPIGSCRSFTIHWEECGAGYCAETEFIPCGSTTPTETPTPTPEPTATPDCSSLDPNDKDNPECFCGPNAFGTLVWICPDCFEGVHASFRQYPTNNGCRSDMRTVSLNCCACIDQSPCPDGSGRNKFTCDCPPTPPACPSFWETYDEEAGACCLDLRPRFHALRRYRIRSAPSRSKEAAAARPSSLMSRAMDFK